ncbi:MAG: biopolymer transporter ExbD [Verrucomicrobiae bacterium]|nr:biopolymer transporter ExbD [Verrucomicrobiae bacterium]
MSSGHGSDKKKKRRRKKTEQFPEEDPEFQIAPMIDVLLVLLVFFMSISSSEVLSKGALNEIKLAGAKDAMDKDPKALEAVINVRYTPMGDAHGINFDGVKEFTEPSQLTELLNQKKEVIRKVNEKDLARFRVLVRADRGVKYSYLQQVMRAAAAAGIWNITFSVLENAQESNIDAIKNLKKP